MTNTCNKITWVDSTTIAVAIATRNTPQGQDEMQNISYEANQNLSDLKNGTKMSTVQLHNN